MAFQDPLQHFLRNPRFLLATKFIVKKTKHRSRKTIFLRPCGVFATWDTPEFDRRKDYRALLKQLVRLMLLLRQKLESLEIKLFELQSDVTGWQLIEKVFRLQ